MNLHEYQGKALFAEYGLPVSIGHAVESAEAAIEAATKIGGNQWVVKAQVHAGGRGKAGGVKLIDSPQAAGDCCIGFYRAILPARAMLFDLHTACVHSGNVVLHRCAAALGAHPRRTITRDYRGPWI